MSLFQKASKPVRLLIAFAWFVVGAAGLLVVLSDEPYRLAGAGLLWLAGFQAGHGATIEDQEADARLKVDGHA